MNYTKIYNRAAKAPLAIRKKLGKKLSRHATKVHKRKGYHPQLPYVATY